MIGKQIKGRSFRGLLNYLEENSKAEIIGGNMSGRNAIQLSKEFRLSRQLNPEVERAVYHCSLSLAPGEHLDVATCNYKCPNLQSRHFQTRIICNYNFASARIICN